jgi:hypothetical protein
MAGQSKHGHAPSRWLDARRPRQHNVRVRVRLLLIAVALALLVIAGARHRVEPDSHDRNPAQGQMAGQPAPEPDASPVIGAAVTASGSAQAHPVLVWSRHARPAVCALAAGPRAPSLPLDTTAPRHFPLLI